MGQADRVQEQGRWRKVRMDQFPVCRFEVKLEAARFRGCTAIVVELGSTDSMGARRGRRLKRGGVRRELRA
jgi:hypothetical protein